MTGWCLPLPAPGVIPYYQEPPAMSESVEYGILREGVEHRSRMTRVDAAEWIREWEADGGRVGLFTVGRRVVGPWVQYPDCPECGSGTGGWAGMRCSTCGWEQPAVSLPVEEQQ